MSDSVLKFFAFFKVKILCLFSFNSMQIISESFHVDGAVEFVLSFSLIPDCFSVTSFSKPKTARICSFFSSSSLSYWSWLIDELISIPLKTMLFSMLCLYLFSLATLAMMMIMDGYLWLPNNCFGPIACRSYT
jgi:hypothetical protein